MDVAFAADVPISAALIFSIPFRYRSLQFSTFSRRKSHRRGTGYIWRVTTSRCRPYTEATHTHTHTHTLLATASSNFLLEACRNSARRSTSNYRSVTAKYSQ